LILGVINVFMTVIPAWTLTYAILVTYGYLI
jgi:hypothetical protein